MRAYLTATVGLISLFILKGESWAAQPCDTALIKSTYNSFSGDHLDWRLATLVTSKEHDEIKHDEGASAVIYGVPIGENYADFQKSSNEKLNSHNESLSRDQFRNILWTGLDSNSVTAYSECLKAQVFSGRGLHMAVVSATASDVTIAISYNPEGSDAPEITPRWTWAAPGKDSLPTRVHQGHTTAVMPRPKVARTLAVNSGGLTDFVVLVPIETIKDPPIPKPLVNVEESYRSDSLPSGSFTGFSSTYHLCSEAKPDGWTIVSENFRLEGDRSCTTGYANCSLKSKTATSVCYEFNMQGHQEVSHCCGNTGIYNSTGVLTVVWAHR